MRIEIKSMFGEYTLDVIKGKSISVKYGEHEANLFHIGDYAEFDSYNLHYDGIITGITDKTVTIMDGSYRTPKFKRLKLEQFAWRNWDFDKQKNDARNAETMMYI